MFVIFFRLMQPVMSVEFKPQFQYKSFAKLARVTEQSTGQFLH